MPKRDKKHQYLQKRGPWFWYMRKIPQRVRHAYPVEQTYIRESLQTQSLLLAIERRDLQKKADDLFWDAIALDGDPTKKHAAAYEQAVARAKCFNFEYKTADEISKLPLGDIEQRIDQAHDKPQYANALLGGVDQPKIKVSEAFEIYIKKEEVNHITKSVTQRANWLKVKRRAVNNFIKQVGDIYMQDIKRPHAIKLYEYWAVRIKAGEVTPSSGNRDMGNMRVLYREYFSYTNNGTKQKNTPFDNLFFKDIYKKRKKYKRHTFSRDYIEQVLLKPRALGNLNFQAVCIFFVICETGARPSEIVNLLPNNIVLVYEIPHIKIRPILPHEGGPVRELKAFASERTIPLTGIALEVFKRFPEGFSRYMGKEEGFSQVLSRAMKRPRLKAIAQTRGFEDEWQKGVIYSLRHSFEDRMKKQKISDDMRRYLMGHELGDNRSEYGEGWHLTTKLEAMTSVSLRYPANLLSSYENN